MIDVFCFFVFFCFFAFVYYHQILISFFHEQIDQQFSVTFWRDAAISLGLVIIAGITSGLLMGFMSVKNDCGVLIFEKNKKI